jgi:hypothetical protein
MTTPNLITKGEGVIGKLITNNGIVFNDATTLNTGLVESPFTVNGGTKGTAPTFNGAPLFTGSYIKIGNLVHFEIQVDMDNITSFGTGQYFVSLPFPAKYPYKFREGCLHDISASKDYEIGGHVLANSTELLLSSTDSQGNSVFDVPFTATNPITIAVADNFHVSGTYIASDD